MLTLNLAELFPRSIEVGGSLGYCGALDIVAITKPLSAGEDAVLAWCLAQDSAYLTDLGYLADGRDVFVLRRLHKKQTLDAAVSEQVEHMKKTLSGRVAIAT